MLIFIKNNYWLRVILFLVGSLLICYLTVAILEGSLKSRNPKLIGEKLFPNNVVELAAPDEKSFRSYYYYQKMI